LLDATFALARGAGDGLGAWGGVLRGSRQLGSTPLLVTGSLRYETQTSSLPLATVSMQWVWATVGMSVATDLAAPVSFEARLEPTLGWIRASAAQSAQSQSGPLFGVREGVAATWWWTDWLGVTAGGEALETRSADVRAVTGGPTYQKVTTEEWFGWGIAMGLRFRPL
jgi:hypothetical protein